jgi:hypothetical protein
VSENKVGTIPSWPEVHDAMVITQPSIHTTSVTTHCTIRRIIRDIVQVENSTQNRNYASNLEFDVQPIVSIAPRPYTWYKLCVFSIRVHLKHLVQWLTCYIVVKTNLFGQPIE